MEKKKDNIEHIIAANTARWEASQNKFKEKVAKKNRKSFERLEESINEEFKLINFFYKYLEGGVHGKAESDYKYLESNRIDKNKSQFRIPPSTTIDQKGKFWETYLKQGINKSLFRDKFLKHFNEEKKDPNLNKIDFIDAQLHYLDVQKSELKEKYLLILTSLKNSFEEERAKLIEPRAGVSPPQSDFTHRKRAIAHLLKVDMGEAKEIPRKDQKPKGLEKAFDSLNPKTKNIENPFKPANKKEMEDVILMLEKDNAPKALEEAKERLKKLKQGNQ